MRIVRKIYIQKYDFLLLVSIAVISIAMYSILQNSDKPLLHPDITVSEPTKVVSITLSKACVVQKKIKPIKTKKLTRTKKRTKVKTVKKVLVKEEALIKEESVQEQELVEETPSVEPFKPLFNAQEKEEFIAGLYRILNQNKHYPKMAKRRHIEGVAHIQFKLLKDGSLVHITIHKSCGHNILDNAALKLVTNIEKYKPIPDSVSLAALDLNIPIKYSRQ